jgi:hypothetical protein
MGEAMPGRRDARMYWIVTIASAVGLAGILIVAALATSGI